MSKSDFQIDYTAARGSNTGDQYHELWAARQALTLLDSDSPISAITVEGLTTKEGTETIWAGVDCSAFFGGDSASEADRVEVQQLKYSAANPTTAWTTTRFCSGKDGKLKTSPIRRLADVYKGLIDKRPGKPADTVRISLVSNQPVATDLLTVIEEARKAVSPRYSGAWKSGMPDLHRLVHASGLKPADFPGFANALDLQGSSGSRFAIEDSTLKAISMWTDVELQESANRLCRYIRKRMLPEAAGELITREKILLQFGVSDDYALFPCTSKIGPVASAVSRAIASDIVDQMKADTRHVCLHGAGGSGKTTALQQIEPLLPDGSMMVIFDCYGAGSYLDASALRHRPQDAFVQITNDIASGLRLPLLLLPRATHDYPRAFRKRLELAATAMAAAAPTGLLVVAIDAADNSILAAQDRLPAEVSFIHDLLTLDHLPDNVRILVSTRTGRLDELRLPKHFRKFRLPEFSRAETASNVARYLEASSPWIDDFHHLSQGIPRVQAYAFGRSASAPENALEALRPFGKNLDQVFREQILFALSKNARESDLENVCAGLISLPRPIPIADLAAVLSLSAEKINDVCTDLAPGVRSADGLLSFADEDFESFIREAAGTAVASVQARTADHFLRHARSNAYAALNVAPALFLVGRGKDLLELVEQEPEPATELIPDPIRRREVQLKRLQTAIRVCREAKDPAHALRFVLIGAEAIKTEEATLKLLVENPGLTSRYAKDTASRLILGDPDRISSHGPLLLHLLAEDATRADAISVREGWRRLRAWERARRDDYEDRQQRNGSDSDWPISPNDAASAIYSTLLLEGAAAAVEHYRRVSPREFAHLSGKSLIDRLLAEKKAELVEQMASLLPDIHALFLLVPLAATGRAVDLQRLTSGLRRIKPRMRVTRNSLTRWDSADLGLGPWIIDTAMAAAEILVARDGEKHAVTETINPFLDPELRRIDKVYESNHLLIDIVFRAVTLADAMADKETTSDQIFLPRPSLPKEGPNKAKHDSYATQHDRELGELVSAFAELYIARARLLASSGRNKAGDFDLLAKARNQLERHSWSIDHRYTTRSMRAKTADSLALLFVADVLPTLVMESALAVRKGWSPRDASTLFYRLAAIPILSNALIEGIGQAADSIRLQRNAAEERSGTLSAYARLISTVSPSDADAIFKWAIDIAVELDLEIMDQLRLIGQMVKQCHHKVGARGRPLAIELSEVVHDAAIRLDGYDHFPWPQVTRALSLLDYPVALAAIARWDDAEVSRLHQTLDSLVVVGLAYGKLSASHAAALAGLSQGISEAVLLKICECAERDGKEVAQKTAEEFARDFLLQRFDEGEPLLSFILRHDVGYWTKRWRAQHDFTKSLEAAPSSATGSARTNSNERGDTATRLNHWAETALTDAELLGKEVRRLVQQSRESEHFVSTKKVLAEASEQVPTHLKAAHFDALVQLDATWEDDQVLEALLDRLNDWAMSPATQQWRNQHLAELLVSRLHALCRFLPHHDSELRSALAMIQSAGVSVQDVLLRGIERNIDYFSATSTFALTSIISEHLKAEQVAELCDWYVTRLSSRVGPAERENVAEAVLPTSMEEALGRFFYAFLGNVDVRVRWRCAHSLRRLARMGDQKILDAVVSQYQRQEEPAYRGCVAPFYWIAARLWLVIAMDRISLESPGAAAEHGTWLMHVALGTEFPHLIVRSFAHDGCMKLVESGHLLIADEIKQTLAKVNQSPFPYASKQRSYGNTFDGFNDHGKGLRFHFDGLDTLRYWYDGVLRAFSDVNPEEFLVAAEQWIVDAWGVRDVESVNVRERRRHRYNDRNWSLYSNSHGSRPTLENFQTYLEWNAMWCVAGQLLRTHELAPIRYGEDELEQEIGYNKLTVAPIWLSDLARPPPLQDSRWRAPTIPIAEWLESVSDDTFITEAMPSDWPDYVVVHAHIDDMSDSHHQTTRVSTGLVSPDTAHSLVRALQTTVDSSNFYICPEGHDCEIDEVGFKLTGWLASHERDSRLDDKDVFRNGISRIEFGPGKSATELFGLQRRVGRETSWYRVGQETPCFIYEAWGSQRDETEHTRHYGSTTESSGHRLLINRRELTEFLTKKKRDLILEVEITRREPERRGHSDNEESSKENEFERILLFRRDGSIQAAERDLGTWRSHRS